MLIKKIETVTKLPFNRTLVRTTHVGKFRDKNIVVQSEIIDGKTQNSIINIWNNTMEIICNKVRRKDGKFDKYI